MNSPTAFAAALLEPSLSAQAAGVALALREALGAEACARLGRFEELSGDARMRLRHLVEAAALDCTALYVDFLAWQQATHAARAFEANWLALALRCQREVLAESLPRAAMAALEPLLVAGEQRLAQPPAEFVAVSAGPHGARIAALLECALQGQRAEVLALARRGVTELGEQVFVEEVLAGLLTELGWLWQRGEIHVGEEHLVSRQIEDVLTQLTVSAAPAAPSGARVLIAAPAGDLHELGARMLALRFRSRGWETFLLGANVPAADLARSALELEPALVLLTVSQGLFARAAGETIRALRAAAPALVVLVGGAPFRSSPELWRKLGADGTAASASAAEEQGRAWLARR